LKTSISFGGCSCQCQRDWQQRANLQFFKEFPPRWGVIFREVSFQSAPRRLSRSETHFMDLYNEKRQVTSRILAAGKMEFNLRTKRRQARLTLLEQVNGESEPSKLAHSLPLPVVTTDKGNLQVTVF